MMMLARTIKVKAAADNGYSAGATTMQGNTAPVAATASIDQIIGLIDEWRAHRILGDSWPTKHVVGGVAHAKCDDRAPSDRQGNRSVEAAVAAFSTAIDDLFELGLGGRSHQANLVLSLLESSARALRNRFEA
jgi:hypothetical protein